MTVREIFEKCLEMDSIRREAYLAEACANDEDLRAEVRALLAEHERTSSFFLDRKLHQIIEHNPITEEVGSQIGPYRLMEQIGAGGMGLVFVAEQTKPMRRKVALKIIKPGMDTKNVVARFEAERQALALMDHPNIARVLDGGETESGRPFFVMELVKGIPITDYCDRRNLPPRERLKLFAEVCQAVQHGHQKGVIHRDIKPSNVLVTEHGGNAAAKVIDFGVAKATNQQLTDRTVYTAFQQVIGTPLYMSPEQADLSGLDVDTRSDVYSLGVLLYELLTGVTPFDKQRFHKAAFDEIRRIIREEEPPKPSTRVSTLGDSATSISGHRQTDPGKLKQLLFGELDWIAMKALDKDRGRRYESASLLAQDVQAFLEDAPVQACPPSLAYRSRKLLRRYRVQSAVAAGFLTLLAVSSVVAWFLYGDAKRARDAAIVAQANLRDERDVAIGLRESAEKARSQAEDEQQRAENAEVALKQKVYDYSLFRASDAFKRGDYHTAKASLQQSPESLRNWEWHYLSNTLSAGSRRTQRFDDVLTLTLSHDGQLVANVDSQGHLSVHNLSSGQLLWSKKLEALPLQIAIGKSVKRIYLLYMPVFDSAEKRKVVGNVLGRMKALSEIKTIVLDVKTGAQLYELPRVVYWQESNDGETLATTTMPNVLQLQTSTQLSFVDAKTGKLKQSAKFGGSGGMLPLNRNFSPDGSRCFTLLRDPTSVVRDNVVQCWDVAQAKELWRKSIDGALGLKWVGAKQLALQSLRPRNEVRMAVLPKTKFQFLSSGDGSLISELESPVAGASELSPNGKRVATRDQLGNVVVWDVESREIVENLRVTAGKVGWTSDSSALRMIDEQLGEATVCQLSDSETKLRIPTLPGRVRSLAFSTDGATLFGCVSDDSVRAWHVQTGELSARLPVRIPMDVGCLGKESKAIVGGYDGLYEVRLDTKPSVRRIKGSPEVLAADFYTVSNQPSVTIANAVHVEEYQIAEEIVRKNKIEANFYGFPNIAKSRVGEHFVGSGYAELLWGTSTALERKRLQLLPGIANWRQALEFHPSEPIFALQRDRTVSFFEIDADNDLHLRGQLRGHQGKVSALAFSHDGSRVFTADQSGILFVWNFLTGEQILQTNLSTGPVTAIAVSNDGSHVAAAGDGQVHILSSAPPNDSLRKVRSDTTRAMEIVRDLYRNHRFCEDVQSALSDWKFDDPAVERIARRIAESNGDRAMESAIQFVSDKKKRIHVLVQEGKIREAAKQLAQLAKTVGIVNGEEENSPWRRLDYLSSKWNADNPSGPWKIASTSVNELYEAAVELEPENHYLAFAHAERIAKRGRFREALDEFNRALALTEPYSQAWYRTAFRIAVLHLHLDDIDAYQELCKLALDHLPTADLEIGGKVRAAVWCTYSDQTSEEILYAAHQFIRDLDPSEVAPIGDVTPPDKTRLTDSTRLSEWIHLARGLVSFRLAKYDEAIRWLEPISTLDFQTTSIRYLANECLAAAQTANGLTKPTPLLQMTAAQRVATLQQGNRADGRPVIGDWHISMMLKEMLDEGQQSKTPPAEPTDE